MLLAQVCSGFWDKLSSLPHHHHHPLLQCLLCAFFDGQLVLLMSPVLRAWRQHDQLGPFDEHGLQQVVNLTNY